MNHLNIASLPTVLVVDDSSTIRATVKVFLKVFQDQINVRFAVDGFEAIRTIVEDPPNLVLADVLMPRLSGYQLCALVKQNPMTKNTPFYILSSKDGEVDKAVGRHNGADGYLIKPFSKTVLQQLIRDVLRLKSIDALPA